MIRFIKKIGKAVTIVGRVQKAVDEGKDVKRAIQKIEDKYDDLPDDLRDAWREVKEFADAVGDIV